MKVAFIGWIGVAAVAILCGCESALRDFAFHAPNHGRTFEREVGVVRDAPWWRGADHELFIAVGPPEATLRAFIFEPQFEDGHTPGGDGRGASGDEPVSDSLAHPPARGTILVLHGYRIDSAWVEHVGKDLAHAGYRAVMVDLRGHGGSEGDYVTFGAQESRDLVQVTDELARRNLLEGKLGVWGVSMGAATAIQYAARDPRVEAVVAVAPFTTLREIVPHVMRRLAPGLALAMDDETMTKMIDDAAKEGNFDADEADTLAAARNVTAPILILHGDWDLIVPVEHGRAIHEAAPDHTEFVELNYAGHTLAHVIAAFGDRTTEWFDKHVAEPVE